MSQDSVAGVDANRTPLNALDLIRVVVLLVSLATLALWGFGTWPTPWNVMIGLSAPLATLLVWALFLSPRRVLNLHPFLRAIVELLIYVGVTLAWWSLGQDVIGIAFAVVAVTAGAITGRRTLA